MSERPRVSALSDAAHRDARSPRPAPTHPRRRDTALTSTCRRVGSQLPARDDGRSLAPRSHLCFLRHAGGCYERYEGSKGTGGMFLREQSGDSHLEGRQWPQNTHIPRRLAWRADVQSSAGSQQRRPNARCCAAVCEASEASRGAYMAVAHAYARRHGCPSALRAQTRAQMPNGIRTLNIALPKVGFHQTTLCMIQVCTSRFLHELSMT